MLPMPLAAPTMTRMGSPAAEYLLAFSSRFVRICSIRVGSAEIAGGSPTTSMDTG